MSKWTLKLLKSYKALRLMEVHKQAEPKFARTLKLLYPLLAKRHGADGGNAVMDLGNGLGGETIGSSADEAFVFGAGKPHVASSEEEDGSGDKADQKETHIVMGTGMRQKYVNAGHVSIGKVNLDGSHDDKGQNHDLMGLEASDYKIAPDDEETGDDNDKEPSPTKY